MPSKNPCNRGKEPQLRGQVNWRGIGFLGTLYERSGLPFTAFFSNRAPVGHSVRETNVAEPGFAQHVLDLPSGKTLFKPRAEESGRNHQFALRRIFDWLRLHG